MSVYWRIKVTSEAGVARDTVTMDDAVASLDSFSADAAGNCLEASFTALPNAIDVRPRDVITFQTSADANTWSYRWCGVIVQAGNPRSERVQSYRAVGLKQRFYEVVLREGAITGGDVASMAHEVATLAAARVRGITVPSSFAVTHFELGDRFPALETMGAFLDALAASAGEFIVPTGTSYTYDGVTYTAGEKVPAVAWGADGSGTVFFRRPQAEAREFNEGAASTRVTWEEASAEEYVNSVTLVYATAVQSDRLIAWGRTANPLTQTEPLVVTPLSREFTTAAAAEEASALVTLPNPLDYMSKRTPSLTVQFGTFNNSAWSRDGDLDTYGTLTNGTSVSYGAGARDSVVWRVRMAWYAGFDITIRVNLTYTTTSALIYKIRGADGESNGEPIDLWLPSLPLAGVEFAGTPTASLQLYASQVASGGLPEVYEVEYYVPDCDVASGSASDLLAESFLRPVPDGVSVIDTFAALPAGSPVTQSIELTTLAGETLGLSVKRVEYRISTDEGVVTRYHVGQSFASDLEAQRAVLERLARYATAGSLP